MFQQLDNASVATYQAPYQAPLVASLMLVLTLLQGSSFTLTLAVLSPFASSTLSSFVTLTWLGMYVIATLGLITAFGLNWMSWLVRYRLPLTCLVAGTLFSSAWSVDTNLTIERSVHLIGTTLIALYLGFSLPLIRILRVSAAVLSGLMLASVLAALFYPALGLESYEGQQVWRGVMVSKNTLGFWSAVSILLLLNLSSGNESGYRRALYICFAVVSAICLFKSVSATSALALLSASLVMIYLHIAFSLRLGLIAMIVLGLLVTAMMGMAFYYIDTAELIGRSGDLTGRGAVWQQTWALILDRPLTGFGYGTIWYPTEQSVWIQQSLTDFSWIVYHAHNGLLQIASELGLPLTLLALIMIVQQLIEIVYCQYQRQQPGVLFVLGFTVALLVSNYSEARLLIHRELYWVFFIALPISMLQQVNVFASHTGFNPIPGKLAAHYSEKLRLSRVKQTERRKLKKRFRTHRKIAIVNAKTADQPSGSATSASQEATSTKPFVIDNAPANNSSATRQIDSGASTARELPLKRKMTRRKKKAG
ncbi:MAG: O-antigen ligase family protein [Granulosicoccus sp.]